MEPTDEDAPEVQSRESGDRASVAALAAGFVPGSGVRGLRPRLLASAAFAARNVAARLISLDSPSISPYVPWERGFKAHRLQPVGFLFAYHRGEFTLAALLTVPGSL